MTISRENPHILEVMGLLKNNVASNINCHNIGRILDFDSSNQTCTVELMQIKQFNDKYYNPAPITDVPLIIYGAGGGHITLPNPVGTYCLLFFMDRNIDSFLETGEQYVPETSRMHDFTDCIAITTFKTLVNPIENYDDLAVSILNSGILQENIKADSYTKIYPQSINSQVTVIDNTDEEDPKITTTNYIQTSIDIQATTSTGGEIKLDDKLLIKNNSNDLMSLVSALITAVKNIATVPDESGGTLTANSIQALTDVENQFKTLLKENTQNV